MAEPTRVPEQAEISEIPLERVLRSLREDKSSALVHVFVDQREGEIRVSKGELVSGKYQDSEGDEAVVQLIALVRGRYEIKFDASEPELDEVQDKLSTLVVEAQKRRASLESLYKSIGGPQRVVALDVDKLSESLAEIPDEVNPLINAFDGQLSVAEVVASAPFDELMSLRVIERLLGIDVLIDAVPENPKHEAEKAEAEKAEAEKVEAEKAEAEKVEAEKAEAEKVEAEKAEAEKAEAEKVEAEKAEAEKVEAEKAEADKAEDEKVEAEKVEAEKVEAEKAEADKAEDEKVEAEKEEADKAEADKAEAEKVEAEKVEAEKVEAEKVEAEKVEAEKVEAEKVEAEKVEAEKVDVEKPASKNGQSQQLAMDQSTDHSGEVDGDEASAKRTAHSHGPADLRLVPEDQAEAASRAIKTWNTQSDELGNPVRARWTDYPPEPENIEALSAFMEGTGADGLWGSSTGTPLSEGDDGSEKDLDHWLESDEANFFSTRAGASLDYAEEQNTANKRDVFPIVVAVIIGFFVVVVALYYALKPADHESLGTQISHEQKQDEEAEKSQPMPVIIAEDDEIKIQSPFEAARDQAMGTLAEQGKTVLQPDAPPVTVLRDVEDLAVKVAGNNAEPASPAAQHLAPAPARPSLDHVAKNKKADKQPDSVGKVEAVAKVNSSVQAADKPKVVEAKKPKQAAPVAGPVVASKKTFAQYYTEGTRLLQREKYKPALNAFEAALLQNPGDARVHRSIGQIYYEYGNLEKAMTQYRRALALDPRDAKSHLLMGLVLQEKGKLADARKHYEQYLDLAPNGSEATAVRGILKTLPTGS